MASTTGNFTKSPNVYFDDGTIILVCPSSPTSTTGFRVHRGILASNSHVFADMFALGDGLQAGETFEGCPVIHLPEDNASGMDGLLRMLYERSYGRYAHLFSIQEIEGIMRLATKYMVYHVRSEIVEHLKRLFPATLQSYKSTPLRHDDCFIGLNIALEFNLPLIIPCALYMCSLRESSHIMSAPINSATVLRVLQMRDVLTRLVTADVIKSHIVFAERMCTNDEEDDCEGVDSVMARRIVVAYMNRQIDVFTADPLKVLPLPADEPAETYMCDYCVGERERIEQEYQNRMWSFLPVPARIGRNWLDVYQAQRDALKTWEPVPPGTAVGE